MKRTIGAVAAFLSVACDRRPQDPVLDLPPAQWAERSRDLPTSEVFALYKASTELPGRPGFPFAQVLGERGREAVALWVEDLEATGDLDIPAEFGPILSLVKARTGYALCTDRALYARASAALSRTKNVSSDRAKEILSPFCA